MRPKEVGLVGFDNVTGSHLAGTADALAAAFLEDGFGGRIPCYKIWTIGLTKEPFVTEAGFLIYPQRTLATAPPLDTIIIAGGSGARRPEVGAELGEWLLSRVYETRRIAAICTGLYALAPSGLVDGREVTTHWRFASDLRRRYPTLRIDHKRRLVKDGPFYTAAGLTAGVELALALVEEDYGKHFVLSLGQELMTYLGGKTTPNDPLVLPEEESRPIDRFGELVAWIMHNLQQDLTVEVMAKRACLSPSHFTRAFSSVFGNTPGEFVENLRLNEARRRLSSRGKTLRSVAASVGFRDTASFRRAFARRFGTGPGSYVNGQVAAPLASPARSEAPAKVTARSSYR